MRNIICSIFGHKQKLVTGGGYWSRRGRRWEYTSHAYCLRCGCGEPEAWNHGLVGRLRLEWGKFSWRLRTRKDRDGREYYPDDIPF